MAKRERIVVIDDNAGDVQLVRRVLERQGYEVAAAHSGEEGLQIVAETVPDCVVVDYRMPGMDGYEVARRMKAEPRLENIPVLMLTGADSSQHVVSGLDAGADDFVTKGSDTDVLLARLRALLRVKAYRDRIVEQSEQLRKLYEELSHKSDKILALNQRMSKDMEIARRVQEALVPPRTFRAERIEIESAYIPSETLSGDFYDYFLQDDHVYLFVADVSGHGLPAAILVSLLKSYIHTEAEGSPSLSELMTRLNDFLFSASLPSQFATAQLFRVDRDRNLRYCNAAHPSFLLFQTAKGHTEVVERPGNLLGAMPNKEFEEYSLPIEPGDTLFAYTDGLTDRCNDEGEFYSIDRVAAVLESRASASLSEVYHAILEDVSSFRATEEFKDDIAFVVSRFH
jgi:serine phosphatase RsbU (regulator of sigma subunit)